MDLFSLWEDLVTYIKSNDSEYSEMFELHLYPVSLSGSVLTISTDHTLPKYQVAWLANVYSRKLESYILKTKNQQITIQVDNYRPPKITPNDGPGPVSAHAPAKDMERKRPAMLSHLLLLRHRSPKGASLRHFRKGMSLLP